MGGLEGGWSRWVDILAPQRHVDVPGVVKRVGKKVGGEG